MSILAPVLASFLLSISANAMSLKLVGIVDQAPIKGCESPKYVVGGEEDLEVKFRIVDSKISQEYEVTVVKNGEKEVTETDSKEFEINIQALPKESQRMSYTVMVKGLKDGKEFASKNFEVIRPLFIEASGDTGKGCYTQYNAEPLTSLISNYTSQNRTYTISDKVIESTVTQKERSMAWLLRFTFFGLVDIGPSLGYMKSEAHEKTQTLERNISTIIMPGETVIIGQRKTLMKVHYNVFAANSCGIHENVGDAYLSYLMTDFPAVSVSQNDPDPFMKLISGENAPINTCVNEEEVGNEVIFDVSNM